MNSLGFSRYEGNWYKKIGDSSTAFMAHLDTACTIAEPICQIEDKGFIHTDGTTILGADDRAGMTILLYMMAHNVPGYYCLFVGEERGCVGSGKARENEEQWEGIVRAVSFDRCGYSSIITHQCGERTASDEFAMELALQLEDFNIIMAPDNTGVFTDSQEFSDLIPECTNISVGYANAHSNREVQDLDFLEILCEACVNVRWEELPTVRSPQDTEYLYSELEDYRTEGCSYYSSEWKGKEEELFDSPTQGKWERTNNAWENLKNCLLNGDPMDYWDIAECIREDPEKAAELVEMYAREWHV